MRMMELDMWNEDLLAGDWSMSLPAYHSGGLFGDVKEGCLCGDDPLSLQLQDAVERVRSESPSKNEDILGMEWMESSDLGSFLEVMGNSHDKLLPLEASLIEYTFSIAPEEPVSFDEPTAKHDIKTESFQNSGENMLDNFLYSVPFNGRASHLCPPQTTCDALLSPPSSPEQVAPVIKVEHANTAAGAQTGSLIVVNDASHDLLRDHVIETNVADCGLSFEELDFKFVDGDSVVTFDDASELISSPLSAYDVDSMLSGSLSSSPSSASLSSSIIESSPELYKVILTSSIEGSKRFSPYSKPKASQQSKASCRSRAPAEPVPDHIIGEQLSKKDRKKLQNKNAAIRYRMKKKEEAAGIKTEEQILDEKNLELRTKVDDLQREIKYMKNLMEDVCKAKGLI